MIKTPRYFVRVNGIAASRDLPGARAHAAAEQAMAARPDAAVEIVQIDPATDKELGSIKLQRGNF